MSDRAEIAAMLDELEALIADATPAPWAVFPHWAKNDPCPGPYGDTLLIGAGQYDTLAEVRPGSDDFGTEYEANARLIVAARMRLPALITRVRALLAEAVR